MTFNQKAELKFEITTVDGRCRLAKIAQDHTGRSVLHIETWAMVNYFVYTNIVYNEVMYDIIDAYRLTYTVVFICLKR